MPSYNQPKLGAENWHVPLNENFDDLAIDVIGQVDTFSGLPNPTGETSNNGSLRMFFVHDEDVLYADTGSSWKPVAGAGLQTGGGSGGTGGEITGPFSTTLVGSNDTNSPKGGFGNEVRNAIDQGTPLITVKGAWEYSNGIEFTTGQDTPNDLPVRIDAWGASITFSGDGWAFTNDNTGDAGSALRGESFILKGGFWFSSGNPDGFVRMIDSGGNHLYPQQTRNFKASGKTSAIYQLEEGNKWCESNHLGGRHHLVDTGVRSLASRGTSFQDNLLDNIHLSQVSNYGFDLSGNWIDCVMANPTVIVSSNNAVFLRMNGNMGGTEIIAPELEDAGNQLDNFFLCEVGPRAARGPHVRGGDLGLNFNPITLFDLSNASGNWSFNMDYSNNHNRISAWFGDEGGTRWVMNGSGFKVQTASNPNGSWSTQGSL